MVSFLFYFLLQFLKKQIATQIKKKNDWRRSSGEESVRSSVGVDMRGKEISRLNVSCRRCGIKEQYVVCYRWGTTFVDAKRIRMCVCACVSSQFCCVWFIICVTNDRLRATSYHFQ